MEQLLKISTIPAKFSISVTNATLQHKPSNPSYEMTRQKGGLSIDSTPAKLNIDSFECYNSINPTVGTAVKQAAQKGEQAAFDAGQKYTNQGNMFMRAQPGEDVIEQISQSMFNVNTNVGIKFSPSVPPTISYEEGRLSTEYQLDKLKFDWRVLQGEFEYVPGDVHFELEQRADIEIEYIGGPIYVPKSADPALRFS
ncbi:MAG: DUF6470 family protein [Bacillota bacterium]